MIPIKNRKGLETIINELRKFAHSYLDKYSPSKQQLRTYLLKKILKKDMRASNKKELLNLIDIVVVDLEDQKFVSDKFYSDSKSRSFIKKGYSLNKIRYSLIKKGIDEKYIKGSILKIKNDKENPDLFSAIRLCNKRRIGALREENNRNLFYKKDMGILARAGFSYEISKKVLDINKGDFKKLYKLI